jgi:hypothetical protein
VVAVNKCGGEKFRSGERFGKLVAAAARISNVAHTNSGQIGPLGSSTGRPRPAADPGRIQTLDANGGRAVRANPAGEYRVNSPLTTPYEG